MFDAIEISVLHAENVVFQFSHPVSISRLWVATKTNTVCDFLSDRFASVTTVSSSTEGSMPGSSMQFWPADQAPPEILSLLDKVKAAQHRELVHHGPRYPLLSCVTYGVVPSGYRPQTAAQPLIPGEYAIGFFAEQGIGRGRFVVPPEAAVQNTPQRQ
jgi:hypothetical protein